MSITQQQQKELTLAAVNCEHQIDVDCIRLWRDPTKDGSALAQLMDRIETKVRQYIEQGAAPRYGTIAERAEQGLRNGLWATQQGAAPGADVVMVPRKTVISAREHAPYLGETWRALNDAISAAKHPQQEQPK